MKQRLGLLFVGLLEGLWLSLEVAQCENLPTGRNLSYCYNTSSGKTCFTTFFVNSSLPVRKPFTNASGWCNSAVPGSSLIIVNSLESQKTVESFIGRQELAYETIIIDAQKLSPSESLEWSWVNGHPTIPSEIRNRTEEFHGGACVESEYGKPLTYCVSNVASLFQYICEYSDSKSAFSYRQKNKSYVASEGFATWYDARNECLLFGGDLASITDLQTIGNWSALNKNQRYWIGLHLDKWIWNSTGAELTYTNWKNGYPDELSQEQCTCMKQQCRKEDNLTICELGYYHKWWTCSCNDNYTIVCQKEENSDAATTEIADKEGILPSTSADVKSPSLPVNTAKSVINTSTATTITTTTTPDRSVTSTVITYSSTITGRGITGNYSSTSSMTHEPSNGFSDDQTTAFASPLSPSTVLVNSSNTAEILFFLLLFVAVVFVTVAVILAIRKRKYHRRNEGSSMKNTEQIETISFAYATVVPDNGPSEGTVPPGTTSFTDVEATHRPTPSNSNINASAQPTCEAVNMGRGVQQKPRSADRITACLSPIYSQPYWPPSSASNTVYAEPSS